MTQPASDLPEGNSRSTRALAARVVDHNRRMENHFFQISIDDSRPDCADTGEILVAEMPGGYGENRAFVEAAAAA